MFKKLSTETTGTTKARGDAAEQRALDYLKRQGLRLVARNYRVARGPHARGGEVDLIMRDRDRDGTLLFIEVRARDSDAHGGAAASVTLAKRRRVIFAAGCYVRTLMEVPTCRFDVIAIDGDRIEWLKGAFDVPEDEGRWA
ncbi:YraN family protein [Roseateles aquatilis]|uniref:UPF0102 protein CDN99_12800 n=1 Tax=Roseateles aquatilis TaxID=431061 RepID=A0A246JCB4_9BURK|nr:YraN family protein [Roseateles aquatilis]OWQ90249.1 YraN family protein [Roseateles aquatilis]